MAVSRRYFRSNDEWPAAAEEDGCGARGDLRSEKNDGVGVPFDRRAPKTRQGVALKAGALLVREWKGQLERVMILEEGFAWNGQTFGSLSQIAELHPDFGTAWRTYAAAAGMAGRQAEAARALKEAKRLQPALSVEWVERFHPIVELRTIGAFSSSSRSPHVRAGFVEPQGSCLTRVFTPRRSGFARPLASFPSCLMSSITSAARRRARMTILAAGKNAPCLFAISGSQGCGGEAARHLFSQAPAEAAKRKNVTLR